MRRAGFLQAPLHKPAVEMISGRNRRKKLAGGAAAGALFLSACVPSAKECAARSAPKGRAVCAPAQEGREAAFLIDKTVFSRPGFVEGTGRVLFQQPLFGLNSKELFALRAEFFHESSRLILYSHFSGFSAEAGAHADGGPRRGGPNLGGPNLGGPHRGGPAGGVRVVFAREGGDLIIEAGSGAYQNQALSRQNGFFARNRELDLYVAVQNGGAEQVLVKVWNRLINPSGRLKQRDPFISGGNLMADSSEKPFYSKGQGILWGLDLYKIRLREAERKSRHILLF